MEIFDEKKVNLKVSSTERNLKSANPSSRVIKNNQANNFSNNISNMNSSLQMKDNIVKHF